MAVNLTDLTIQSARKKLDNGDISATELTEEILDQIEEQNDELNAYVEVYDTALEQAKAAQRIIDAGEGGPLTGVPIAIKDNMLVEGEIASCGSKMLEQFQAPEDATAIRKLKEAGVVLLGRTNMDEFAMGSSTENSAFGPTKNPIDTDYVPGGSSGGSAAAVAADMALASLGSDTGGSIRQPASLCGIVGVKPTYGGISRYGLIAMGSSLDQIGPFAKTVEDSRLLYEAMAGVDPRDATTLEKGTYKTTDPKELTVGAPLHMIEQDGIDEDVLDVFHDNIETLKSAGVTVKEIEMPNLEYALAVYYIVMPAEVSSNLARFDGVKYGHHEDADDLIADYKETRGEGFGEEVIRRIVLGSYVLSAGYYDAYYRGAEKVRTLLQKEFADAFSQVDGVITPTTPTPAFKLGDKTDDPLSMYLQDMFTVPANIAGVPGISVPAGTVAVDGTDLPLGLQIMTAHQNEDVMFRIAKQFEEARE